MAEVAPPDMTGIDPSLLQDFISESQETLDGLDPLFVQMEANPDDISIVDGIFRPVHSVKGNSGFFGLTNIKNFAHIMENILGEIRSRKRQTTPHIVDLLLKGVDFLRGMMARLAQGDLSGKFTPEEEAHLEVLNQASSGASPADAAPEKPEDKAKKLLDALKDARIHFDDQSMAAILEDAANSFILSVLPNFSSGNGASGSAESPVFAYRLGGRDVTGAVASIDGFLSNLERNEKEEASCEAFATALETIALIAKEAVPDVIPLVDQIKDDFITIHESGIGFDELMTSLIKERFAAILGRVEKIEIGGGEGYFLEGSDVSEQAALMKGFVAGIQAAEKDGARSDAFVATIQELKDAAPARPPLLAALEQIQDDYLTIHESGIGFDDLMASLLQERLAAVLANLDRGAAGPAGAVPAAGFRLGQADVSGEARTISEFAGNSGAASADPEKLALFDRAVSSLAAAAEAAGKAELAGAAASLAADVKALAASGVGIDETMRKMISSRTDSILAGLEKAAPAAAPEEKAEAKKASGPASPAQPSGEAPKEPAKEPAKQAAGHAEASGKTLRVAEEKVDSFMSYVGELIITGEVFAYIQKKLESYPEVRQVAQEFKNANLAFGELSSNLQKSLMEVRRVPLKSVLQKLPRIIRDTATQLGKKIDLEIVGEDVQIDKSLLEGLESPLVHMVRNSADHGVETPEDRKAAGKSEAGHVVITAKATEEQFSLTIKDDGKGLDVEALKAKAVSRGILTEEGARQMPDKEAFRLVFAAGLSTAKVVTDVSGRGVGMDVVLSNITKMNGNISIESVKGGGSVFTILLPMTVTLTVIDGLVARIGDQNYIIPISDVKESVRPERSHLHTVRGGQEVLNVRGELHPIIHLSRLLGVGTGGETDPCEATVVLAQGKRGEAAAFVVDEIVGQQSVVVKELGKEFGNITCIQGGSILGDGRVGLVIDIQGILADLGMVKAE